MDLFTAQELKEEGIEKAINNADRSVKNWSSMAYSFLKGFARTRFAFMAEEVREASEGIIPKPPSNRAWGSVITKAKKEGIIIHHGYGQVKNPKAHRANASIWKSNIYIF